MNADYHAAVYSVAGLAQRCSQGGSHVVNAGCDALEALRAVVDRVHGCNVSQQRLGGADVGSSFVAADVLLAALFVNNNMPLKPTGRYNRRTVFAWPCAEPYCPGHRWRRR